MPIKHAIWKVGDQPAPLTITTLFGELQPRRDANPLTCDEQPPTQS
jgi:hypothetical protein